MRLTVDNQRNLVGEMRNNSGTRAGLTGKNVAPGQLRISLPGRGTFLYRKFVCENRISSLYREPRCLEDIWIASIAPPEVKKFKACGEDCKLFTETKEEDSEIFISITDWATMGDQQPFTGDVYEKGSPIALAVFKVGTFLQPIQPTIGIQAQANEVKAAKQTITEQLEAKGLRVNITQGSRGRTDFILTIVGRSPQLEFPVGYWFKTRVQLACFSRSEAQAPNGKVEQLEIHVIGTKIFRGPSTANLFSDQFQPISRVDRHLDDFSVDAALAVEITNLFADKLDGTITTVPEGL